MSKVFHKLSTGNFLQDWSNTGQITANNDWSGVASIMGYRGDGLASPAGRDPRLVTGDSTVVNVNANQANPNTYTSGGVTEFHIADPVVALQGSGTAQAPSLVFYLDASGRQDLRFAVDLRDIDGGGDNSVQQIAVQYRIGDSGAWTALPSGHVPDASTGPNQATQVTHLDIALPAAVNNQSQVEIRVLTADAVGSDEWIGIDNIVVSSAPMGPDTTAPLLSSSAPADDAIGIAPQAKLVLGFNELIALGAGTVTITDGAGDTRVIDVTDASQVSVSGQTLVIDPAADLQMGAEYHVSVSAGAVLDMAGNAWGGTGADPIDFRTIAALTHTYEIQGAGHTSPLAGSLVNTRGVVTAIDTTGTRGFWIQDQQGDGDSATSDAVFVFSTAALTQVKVGDLVELQGTVEEYSGNNANNLSITEVTGVQNLKVLSGGHTVSASILGAGGRLPPTATIDDDNFAVFDPQDDAIDFYESMEGMLVTATGVQAVSNTDDGATFVVVDGGAGATGMNDRGAITITQGDYNPERFQVYTDTGVASYTPDSYNVGDKLGDVTGIMTYYGGNFELVPTEAPDAPVRAAIPRETTGLAGGDAHLTVGAYNLGNIDALDPQAKFDALARDIAANLAAPDILGLEEIQDNNGKGTGVLAADLTLGKLIDAIVAAGGPRYAYVEISPTVENQNGGEANGNIRNAILYNPERVDYMDGSARLLADTTPADGDGFRNSRRPLAAEFEFNGEVLTFVGVHNYSRLGGDELFGLNQPAFISGDARRNDQTLAIRDAVQQMLAADPNANIVVAGDFNGFQFETSLTQLETGGLHNLAWTLPETDRYSASYQGNNQQLDHLLVSGALRDGALFDNVHLNSNLPFGTATDHDAVLARVLVNTAPVATADAAYAASEDTVLTIAAGAGVLANDTDRNGDALAAALVDGPDHGTLQLAADGSFIYIPHADWHGEDSFTYRAADGQGGASADASVVISVASVNDLPVGAADAASVSEGGQVLIDVLANDSDADGDRLAVSLPLAKSALGATLVVEDGQVRYVADADAFDLLAPGATVEDSFTYVAIDPNGAASAPVTVRVTVGEAGDAQSAAGSNKADVYVDQPGRDTTYRAGNGSDSVAGMDGADRLYGENGDDLLAGGDGSDLLDGGTGIDVLFGGAGDDRLLGGNGDDLLAGGAGTDVLEGGLGADLFVLGTGGSATIADFKPGADRIVTGYAGGESRAALDAWLASHIPAAGFGVADADTNGDGIADSAAVTGGGLGQGGVVLAGWTVAALVGQQLLDANGQPAGGWIA